jgi:hypothetical protein
LALIEATRASIIFFASPRLAPAAALFASSGM